ncbi:hypothetical protein EDD86DRAFT_249857 [Gorgonomyces haynaldii]|nr:hypothetical protein EDD86DRAFT_249857 [Gorgonomyces haynaldii]
MLANLPKELLKIIMQFLDTKSYLNLCKTNIMFHRLMYPFQCQFKMTDFARAVEWKSSVAQSMLQYQAFDHCHAFKYDCGLLEFLSMHGQTEMVQQLFRLYPTSVRQKALMLAAGEGHLEIVKLLMPNLSWNQAFTSAAWMDHHEIVQHLLDSGFDLQKAKRSLPMLQLLDRYFELTRLKQNHNLLELYGSVQLVLKSPRLEMLFDQLSDHPQMLYLLFLLAQPTETTAALEFDPKSFELQDLDLFPMQTLDFDDLRWRLPDLPVRPPQLLPYKPRMVLEDERQETDSEATNVWEDCLDHTLERHLNWEHATVGHLLTETRICYHEPLSPLVSQEFLMEQVLLLLGGYESVLLDNSFRFIHTQTTLAQSLDAYVQQCISHYHKFQALLKRSQTLEDSLVERAFSSALKDTLSELRSQLIDIKPNGPLDLFCQSNNVRKKIGLLHDLLTPNILPRLHQRTLFLESIQPEPLFSDLLFHTIQPYCIWIEQWFSGNPMFDPFREFFIQDNHYFETLVPCFLPKDLCLDIYWSGRWKNQLSLDIPRLSVQYHQSIDNQRTMVQNQVSLSLLEWKKKTLDEKLEFLENRRLFKIQQLKEQQLEERRQEEASIKYRQYLRLLHDKEEQKILRKFQEAMQVLEKREQRLQWRLKRMQLNEKRALVDQQSILDDYLSPSVVEDVPVVVEDVPVEAEEVKETAQTVTDILKAESRDVQTDAQVEDKSVGVQAETETVAFQTAIVQTETQEEIMEEAVKETEDRTVDRIKEWIHGKRINRDMESIHRLIQDSMIYQWQKQTQLLYHQSLSLVFERGLCSILNDLKQVFLMQDGLFTSYLTDALFKQDHLNLNGHYRFTKHQLSQTLEDVVKDYPSCQFIVSNDFDLPIHKCLTLIYHLPPQFGFLQEQIQSLSIIFSFLLQLLQAQEALSRLQKMDIFQDADKKMVIQFMQQARSFVSTMMHYCFQVGIVKWFDLEAYVSEVQSSVKFLDPKDTMTDFTIPKLQKQLERTLDDIQWRLFVHNQQKVESQLIQDQLQCICKFSSLVQSNTKQGMATLFFLFKSGHQKLEKHLDLIIRTHSFGSKQMQRDFSCFQTLYRWMHS